MVWAKEINLLCGNSKLAALVDEWTGWHQFLAARGHVEDVCELDGFAAMILDNDVALLLYYVGAISNTDSKGDIVDRGR